MATDARLSDPGAANSQAATVRSSRSGSANAPAAPKAPRSSLGRRLTLACLFLAQILCVAFFIYDLFGGQLGLRSAPISWMARELIQVGALAGLVIGAVLTAVALFRSERRREAAEMELAELSQAFHDLMQNRFTDWGLTPAERDVALFIVKGFSIQEISGLRETSEGTVKAQMAAIYRKAGVSSRAQLVTLFIDHLIEPFPDGVA